MNILSPLGFLWNSLFYHPIVNLILVIYKLTGHNLGIAIIVLTILIRLVLWPFMKSQVDSVKRIQNLKPKLDALKEKHKNDKKAFQEAQLKLYKENGVNPAGSCLPLLIQLPFIYAVYNVIRAAATSSNAAIFNNIVYSPALKLSPTTSFNTNFLGINLAKDAASIGFHDLRIVLPYILIAVLVGATQYFASKVSLPANVEESTEVIEALESENKNSKGKKQKNTKAIVENKTNASTNSFDPEAFSKNLSTQMLFIFPLLLTWISLGFSGSIPAGLSIYWIIQSLMLVIQTLLLQSNLPWKMNK